MRVKLEWLNELVDLSGLSLDEIVNKASLYSIEIEGVDRVARGTNLVIGYVKTKEKHPDSDHLNCLTVDVGDEVLDIVCGAPNVEAGQYVIVAKEGAELIGGTIKKSKIRGVPSCGMCCSLAELGVEHKYVEEKFANGIYYFEKALEEGIKVGMEGLKALNFADDILELGITPNRGDLLSMIGVAYEFSASFDRPLKPLTFKLVRDAIKDDEKIDIKIETNGCVGYYGQLIKDAKLNRSPRWLISRLIAFGVRPINLFVDITNYILALFGQPLHAFDFEKIGRHIVIKNASEGDKFTTLDEIERTLKDSDAVITDGKDAKCLGGVMGGLNSEITDSTTSIMLEAAVFDPMTIRRTAARLNLHSESSMRYERGVDINRTKQALDYACFLFKTLGEAKICGEPSFAGIQKIEDKKISLSTYQVNKLLGTNLDLSEVKDIFTKLNFKYDEKENNTLLVYVPNRRPDITIKEDLIEEVARLHGYEKLENTIPMDRSCGKLGVRAINKRKIGKLLTNLGLDEVITYSLVSKEQNCTFTLNHKEGIEDLNLLMPINEERKTLRQGLIPSLLDVMKYNFSRKIDNVSVFEFGNVYYNIEGNHYEDLYLGITMANTFSRTRWKGFNEKVDFFLLKGILEQVFASLDKTAEYVAIDPKCNELHPSRTAVIMVDGKQIGFIGQVHPMFARKNDLDESYVAEINIQSLLDSEKDVHHYVSVPKLPSVERDIAVVVKKDVKAIDLVNAIKKTDKQILSDVIVFDVYEGEKIADDEKSIALKLVFTSNEPLTDEIINAKMKKVIKDLAYRFNAKLRD
ncbi:MAG: phenylalanine--tRNA ligase subunit beta [Bacilli bacterium]|nr:phenylalanine--tRNA ligase subunit beta [Bacilli bacterium]